MLIWPMSNVETGDAMNIIILKKRVGNIRTPFIFYELTMSSSATIRLFVRKSGRGPGARYR